MISNPLTVRSEERQEGKAKGAEEGGKERGQEGERACCWFGRWNTRRRTKVKGSLRLDAKRYLRHGRFQAVLFERRWSSIYSLLLEGVRPRTLQHLVRRVQIPRRVVQGIYNLRRISSTVEPIDDLILVIRYRYSCLAILSVVCTSDLIKCEKPLLPALVYSAKTTTAPSVESGYGVART